MLVATRWVYDFADRSREMREMRRQRRRDTRILGADRVPAGFTITTEACVEYLPRQRTSARRRPLRLTVADAGRQPRRDGSR